MTKLPERPTLSIQQALNFGLEHHNAGRLSDAESSYQQVLQADPNQPVALNLLGVIAHTVGQYDSAVDLITKALTIKPDFAEAYSNLGNALSYARIWCLSI
jgi:Flp pilus assembly protein TadD